MEGVITSTTISPTAHLIAHARDKADYFARAAELVKPDETAVDYRLAHAVITALADALEAGMAKAKGGAE